MKQIPDKIFQYKDQIITINELLEYIAKYPQAYSELDTSRQVHFFLRFTNALVQGRSIILGDLDRVLPGNNSLKESITIKDYNDLVRVIKESNSKIGIYTSGTTGKAKVHFHTVQNLIRTVKEKEIYTDSIWASGYNLGHMAFIQVYFQVVLNKSKLYSLYGVNSHEIKESLHQIPFTNISATPSFFKLLDSSVRSTSIRTVTMGGERVEEQLLKKISNCFPSAKIRNIYASTEAGSILNSDGEYFKIREELKGAVKMINNEIMIHHSLLSVNLADQSEWYATGDFVEFSEDRTKFKIIGRSSEIINVGGEKINLHQIEDKIRKLSMVDDVRAYAIKNSVLGNIIGADVKLCPGENLNETELTKLLESDMLPYMVPRIINFVSYLQLTKTLKKKR